MPSFSGIEVTAQVDVDFEVFCGTCAKCMENAKDDGRRDAEAEYEQQLSELREALAEARAARYA